jgi:hypothetical protein
MQSKPLSTLALFLLALAGPGLAAQVAAPALAGASGPALPAAGPGPAEPGPAATVSATGYGLMGAVTFPLADLRDLVDGKPGLNVAAFALFDLGKGQGLRARVDWFQASSASSYSGPLALGGANATVAIRANKDLRAWSGGADYLRFFNIVRNDGFYLLAGLGLSFNRYSVGLAEAVGGTQGTDGYALRNTTFYWNLGFGYQINASFGLEACYRRTSLSGDNLATTETTTVGGVSTSRTVAVNLPTQALSFWSLGATMRF